MNEKYMRYQSLSLQEAKAVEREVTAQIQYAFYLGQQTVLKQQQINNAALSKGPSVGLH